MFHQHFSHIRCQPKQYGTAVAVAAPRLNPVTGGLGTLVTTVTLSVNVSVIWLLVSIY